MNIPSIYDESSVVVLEIIETMPWEDDTCTNDDEEILESTNQDVFLIETMRSWYELSQSVTDTLLHSINGILFWILIQQLLLERSLTVIGWSERNRIFWIQIVHVVFVKIMALAFKSNI
jgi:hypothetical protein